MQYDMTRAWKDEAYRESLDEAIESPVAELSEVELEQINGTGAGGGGGIGYGGGVSQGYTAAGGIVGNSYYCGNFSIRPRTNLNLDGRRDEDSPEAEGGSEASLISSDSSRRDRRTNRFDFSCSVSGGFTGFCLFGGK
jgi:mersacidin/lichenicidin family type 2 lantibiotic